MRIEMYIFDGMNRSIVPIVLKTRSDWFFLEVSILFYISIRFSILAYKTHFRTSYITLYTSNSLCIRTSSYKSNSASCLDVVKEEKPRPRPRPDPSGRDFSSLLDVYIVSFEKVTMLTESDLVHQSTWLQSSNTCLLKSWSWLATLHETTRKQELYQDIFNLPSETTRS